VSRLFVLLFILIFGSSSASASYFEDTVRSLIEDKIGSDISFDLRFESEKKLLEIISDESKIKTISMTFFSPKSKSFNISVSFKNSKDTQRQIFGKFDAFYEVYSASRMIKFGEEVTSSDFSVTRVRRLSNDDATTKDFPTIQRMVAKAGMRPGQVVKKSYLKRAPIIKENEPVTIMYSTNEINLKTLGIALSSGAIGEKIRVKNDKTGIVVFGEILDKNVVKVNSSEQ
jgi:flagella basal body P-ring formation protein FlgA